MGKWRAIEETIHGGRFMPFETLITVARLGLHHANDIETTLNSAECDKARLAECEGLLKRVAFYRHRDHLPGSLKADIVTFLVKEKPTYRDDPAAFVRACLDDYDPPPDLRTVLQEYVEAHRRLLAVSEKLIASLK